MHIHAHTHAHTHTHTCTYAHTHTHTRTHTHMSFPYKPMKHFGDTQVDCLLAGLSVPTLEDIVIVHFTV